jgi:hypothetical protein
VDDLQHRAALVEAVRAVLDDRDRLRVERVVEARQVARPDACDGGRRGVERVGQRADRDPAAVDPARQAVDPLGEDALRRGGADVGVRT